MDHCRFAWWCGTGPPTATDVLPNGGERQGDVAEEEPCGGGSSGHRTTERA